MATKLHRIGVFTAQYVRDKGLDLQEDISNLRTLLLSQGKQPQSLEWDDNYIIFKGHTIEEVD